MKKCLVIVVLCCFLAWIPTGAEELGVQEGSLYVNNELILKDDTVIKTDDIFIPLRTVFEALGADVLWNSDNDEAEVSYKGKTLVCKRMDPAYPNPYNLMDFTVKDKKTGEYMYLSSMSLLGACRMINDRNYLTAYTASYLFENLKCTMEVDREKNIVKITEKKPT